MKSIFLLIITVFCLNQTWAQANPDSLRSTWQDKSLSDTVRFNALQTFYLDYTYSTPDSSLLASQYHINLAIEKNIVSELAKAFNERALAFYVLNQVDSSIACLNQVLAIQTDLNDSSGIALIQANLGSMYREQNHYQEAIEAYVKSLSFLRGSDNEMAFRADVLNNTGLIYEDIGMNESALDYLNQALELYKQEGLDEKTGNIWLNIGAVEFEQGNTDKALSYMRKANQILLKHNDQWSLATSYHELANVFFKTGQLDSSSFFLEMSIAINQEMGNTQRLLVNLTLKGNLLLESDLEQAVLIGEEVLSSSKALADKSLTASVSELLYKGYKRQHRLGLSLNMLEQYQLYHDSLLAEENQIAVVREAIQKEFELKLLNSQLENERQRAKLELDQVKRVFLIALISILLVLGIAIYARKRINMHQQQKALLLDEIEKLKAAGESVNPLSSGGFQLDRNKIDEKIDRKLNETDWKVLNILLNDPVISNKEIAEQAFMSTDGIGSSLRRMYLSFNIKESKYMKISLLLEAIKISNSKA